MYAPVLPEQDRFAQRRPRVQPEQRSDAPRQASGGDIARLLQLQRSAGNAAVSRLLRAYAGARPVPGSLLQRCGATPCGCPADEQVAHALRDSLGGSPDPLVAQGDGPVQHMMPGALQRDDDTDEEEQARTSQPAGPTAQAETAETAGSDGAGPAASAAPADSAASTTTQDDGSSAAQDTGSSETQAADAGQAGDTSAADGAQVDPVGEITGQGQPKDVEVFGGVSLQGRTNAHFSSSFSTSGTQTTAASACSGCSGNDCVHVTGTLTSTFSMSTSVSLPPVPSGLSACATRRVRYAIQQCLAPHEQQHVAAFNTYRGTSSQPFDLTTCRASLRSELQALHDAVDGPRQATAQAASDALDPYQVDIDLDCEDGERDPSAGVTCP